ncbi:MAG TPA: EI24 domain-containing protein [Acetobacteraceae bacterium]|nr:EI24 domain-containing protein [Acetobacteraceae bacterium]
MYRLLYPLTRAIGQMRDRAFLGVVWRCLAWSTVCFVALHILAVWAAERVLHRHGLLGWAVDLLASFGATLLAAWLFLPLAAVIATLYIERIAAAVEHRYYPGLPPAQGASIATQVWDGVCLGGRILLLNLLALVLALILPGIGVLLAWAIAAYALGRGLFMMVAMRRMPRGAANATYRSARGIIFGYGGVMALAAYLPLLNLFIPILGTASMVHILDLALTRTREYAWR